jgi:hypothetical protein
MTRESSRRSTPKAMLWAGRVVSAIPVLMMGVLGLVLFITKPAMITESMTKYGYPASAAKPVFIIEMICVVLYVIPRTAVLGAILLTGYLGGAVATHVRASEPFWFPVLIGVLVWLGLYLRDARIRAIVPLRR